MKTTEEKIVKLNNNLNRVWLIYLVSVSLSTPEEIWGKADEMLPTEFAEWYKRNVGYER